MQIAEKHIDWCLNNNIQETPTFFINGYYLPKVYQIEDIKRIASRIFT